MSRRSKNYEYAARSIERVGQILRIMPEVAAALGSEAVGLAGLGDCAFPAEVEHGKLIFPKEYEDSHMLPVVALSRGQKVYVPAEASLQTPSQRNRSIRRLTNLGVCDSPEDCVDTANSKVKDHSIKIRDRTAVTVASCLNHPAHGTSDASTVIWGRPIVVVRRYTDEEWAGPATMTHEYKHALQYSRGVEQLPDVVDPRRELREIHEHEAYNSSGIFAAALQQANVTWDAHRDVVHIERRLDYENLRNSRGQS